MRAEKVPQRLRLQFKPCLDSVNAFAEPVFTCKNLLSIQVFANHQKLILCSGSSTHIPFQECAEKVFFANVDIVEKGFYQLHGIKGRVLSFLRQKSYLRPIAAQYWVTREPKPNNMGKTRRKSAGTTPRRRRRGRGKKTRVVTAVVVTRRKKPRKKRHHRKRKAILRGLNMISVGKARRTPRRRQRLGPAATGLVDGFSRLRVTGPHNTRVGRAA